MREAGSNKSVLVIVPVYNDQANLYACINALSHQSLPPADIEIIVVGKWRFATDLEMLLLESNELSAGSAK